MSFKVDGNLVDALVVLCSFIYNIAGILIFVLRANERKQLEAKLGPVFNTLLVPFSLFWVYNLISGRDSGRLITGIPIIIFLAYDLWYRTFTDKKPYHHPEHWPIGLYAYVLLYQISGIMLNGYSFLISLLYGYIVLASYFGSLAAYGYYQYKHKREVKI
jgi:hypothetical protein